MRGLKGSVYQGGIRVPCFIRWPGTLPPGREVDRIAAHIDLAPTLLEICQDAKAPAPLPSQKAPAFDGRSLWPLLTDAGQDWPERTLFFQWHRGDAPEARRAFAARTERYKLVQAAGAQQSTTPACELFDLAADPAEQRDISAAHPEVRERLLKAYDKWFADVTGTRGGDRPRIHVGDPAETRTVLTRQDWRGPGAGWAADSIGHWELLVLKEGYYDLAIDSARVEGDAVLTLGIARAGRTNRLSAPLTAERPKALPNVTHQFSMVHLPGGALDLHCWLQTTGKKLGVRSVEIRSCPDASPR